MKNIKFYQGSIDKMLLVKNKLDNILALGVNTYGERVINSREILLLSAKVNDLKTDIDFKINNYVNDLLPEKDIDWKDIK